MRGVLQEVRDRLGPTPRPFGPGKKSWHRAPIPPGFPRDDELLEVYQKQEMLMREGKVCWGALVQANNQLYHPGLGDHPGTAVFCDHPEIENDPDILADIARSLFRLRKADVVDGEERSYALILKDAQRRAMSVKIPKTQARGLPILSSGIMIFRDHLPSRFLADTLFPMLTHYTTSVVLMVPHPYWADALVRRWLDKAQPIVERFPDAEYVSLTPRAEDEIFALAEEMGLEDPWYVRINVRFEGRRDPPRFSLELDRDYDPHRDTKFRHDELDIIVDRRDAEWIWGLLIDSQARGQRAAFTFVGGRTD
jgi:Fe-S cluster assembly iron-binding protein IscA